MKHTKVTGLVVGLGLLGACAPTDPIYTQFFRPTGDIIEGETFGTATTNNIGVQTGQINYRIDLANRFASEVLTTVNFAFNSSALDEGARETLRVQANWIRQFPEVRFRVYGHTDAVGSEGYKMGLKTIQFDDMNWGGNYHPMNTYCHSKLAQIMFAYELQDRIKAANKQVEVYVCHPGASATSLIKNSGG